jgi:hypothetical protein
MKFKEEVFNEKQDDDSADPPVSPFYHFSPHRKESLHENYARKDGGKSQEQGLR